MNGKEKKKILIVDDVEINRAILTELFSEEYTVTEAANGIEALQILEHNIDSIAVVLLDVSMPVMDGFATITEMIKADYITRVPVIAMTASDDMEHDFSIVEMGAEDIISKPFVGPLVKKRVKNVLLAWEYNKKLKNGGK